jgi:hypothetical protein
MSIDALPVAPSQTDSVTDFDLHAFAFVAELQAFRTQANSTADAMQTNADVTASIAMNMALPNYGGISSTNTIIGTGPKTFTTDTGKSWVVGQTVVISYGGNTANYLKGAITAYSGSTLTVNVTSTGGSGTFASWTIGLSYAALGISPRAARIDVASVAGVVDLTTNAPDTDDIRITGALAITNFTVAVGRVLRVTAGGAFTLTNGAGLVTQTGANIVAAAGDTFMLRATAANVVEVLAYTAIAPSVQVPIRQTVLSGPVDTSGLPTFLPATSVNLNLTTQSVSTGVNALVATAAGGANGSGAINAVGQATANLTWTGCTASNTNYLPVSIAAGALTALTPVILAPIYQWGGTPAVTAGQYTYNIQQGIMWLGNGSTASAVNHVIVGEAVAGASTITSTVEYAYQGRYSTEQVTIAASTAYSFNSGIGTVLQRAIPWMECKTTDLGYAVGDRVYALGADSNGTAYAGTQFWTTKNTCGFTTGTGSLQLPNKSTGGIAASTNANWKLGFEIVRGF